MPATRPDGPREDFAGPESGPEAPFPIKLSGPVVKGFGRGSREVSLDIVVVRDAAGMRDHGHLWNSMWQAGASKDVLMGCWKTMPWLRLEHGR